MTAKKYSLWLRWMAVNALSGLIGLGATDYGEETYPLCR
jgi:hypothetical protein